MSFNEPATAHDRRWWLDLAPTLKWTWASTYAHSAPHWYVVQGKTPDLTYEDYVRIGRVIRTFGEPGNFYGITNLYLYSEDRRLKYWCMWGHDVVEEGDSTLVNLATTEASYGPQDEFDMARVAQLRLPPVQP